MAANLRSSTRGKQPTEPSMPTGVLLQRAMELSPRQEHSVSPSADTDPIARRSDIQDLRDLIQGLVQAVNDHKAYVDQKLTELSDNLKQHFQSQVDGIQNYVDTEIASIGHRVSDIEQRLTDVETATEKPDFDPEVSVIVSNLPVEENEDITEAVSQMVRQGLSLPETRCPVVKAMRLPQRNHGNRTNNRLPGREENGATSKGKSEGYSIMAECILAVV